MARCWLMFLVVVFFWRPFVAEAQHGHFGFHGYSQPWVVNPGLGYSGYSGPGYVRSYPYQNPNPYGPGSYVPQPVGLVSLTIPGITKPMSIEPSKVPVVASSPAARMRSLEHQARGDQRMRQQKWAEARAAYRSSVDAAPDRAEAHLRLGLCLVAIQRFESAIHEFKRALFIDPKIPKMGKISTVLFGPDSQIVRSSILSKVSDWVREDYRDSDRLFLFGVILHFEGDARGSEVLEAAMRMKRKGDVSHITAFLGPNAGLGNGHVHAPIPGIPKLNDKPIPPMPFAPPAVIAPPAKGLTPIPGGPVPMPDL